MNWYYYNVNDQKIGPIPSAVLKSLASQGVITPETKVENDNGRSTLAGKVRGLTFPDTIPPNSDQPNAPPVQFTVEERAEIKKFIARYGSNLKVVDEEGNTLLHQVVSSFGNETFKPDVAIRYLISKGANINAKNNDDTTPLTCAAMKGQVEVVKLLVSKGADVNVGNPIAMAAMCGNVEMIKFLVSAGADVDAGDPIATAVTFGDIEMTKALVSSGANVHWRNDNGETLIDLARRVGHTAIVQYLSNLPAGPNSSRPNEPFTVEEQAEIKKFLARYGNDLKVVDEEGNTLLHRVMSPFGDTFKCDVAVKYLISKGANVNARNNGGATPLLRRLLFIGEEDEIPKLTKLLVSAGADVNAKDKDGKTPLTHCAAMKGQVEVAKFLVSKGADVNAGNPIASAAMYGNVEVVKFLVSKGADVNAKNGERPPIATAVIMGNLEMTKTLVSLGANVHWKNDNGETLIDLARRIGYAAIVQYLSNLPARPNSSRPNVPPQFQFTAEEQAEIEKFLATFGSNVDAVDETGQTLLHRAVVFRKEVLKTDAVLKYLISQGADVNVKGKDDITPLALAMASGQVEVLKFLVSQGADINAGAVPLIVLVVGRGNLEMTKALVSLGADVHWKHENGLTLIDFARKNGHTAIAQYLSNLPASPNSSRPNEPPPVQFTAEERTEIENFCAAYGRDVKAVDENGETLLHQAVYWGKIEVIKFLVSKGADVNAADRNGYTPLHLAASEGRVDFAKFLISNGADVNARDNFGATPLDTAKEKGYAEFVKFCQPVESSPFTLPASNCNPFTLPALGGNNPFSHQMPHSPHDSGKATTSLILGCVGLLVWLIPLLGLPVTIIGLVMGIKGKSTTGTTLCIIGLILTVINAVIGAYLGATGQLF